MSKMAEPILTSIVEVRDWLRAQDDLYHRSVRSLEQFAIDWIEEEIDRAESYLESEEITVDDVTFVGAIHYRADCALEVLRTDAVCFQFFTELARLTGEARDPCVVAGYHVCGRLDHEHLTKGQP